MLQTNSFIHYFFCLFSKLFNYENAKIAQKNNVCNLFNVTNSPSAHNAQPTRKKLWVTLVNTSTSHFVSVKFCLSFHFENPKVIT